MKTTDITETDRLILRPLTLDDAEAAFEWTSDERVARFTSWPLHTSTEDTTEWLRSIPNAENIFDFGFVRKSDGKLIGSGGIRLKDNGFWDFGYNFRYDCWNMGYATEATLAMMDFVRRNCGAKKFRAECAEENIGSARVMEKCGLHFARKGEYSKSDGKTTFRSKIYELKEGNEK